MAHIVIDSCAGRECGGEALEAAAIASLERVHQITVVGDESEVTLALQKIAHDAEHLRVVHAGDRIDPELELRAALLKAPRSSVAVGMELLARDPAAIFVSAGGPGAIVATALQIADLVASDLDDLASTLKRSANDAVIDADQAALTRRVSAATAI